MNALLAITNLSLEYPQRGKVPLRVLENISCVIKRGEIISFVGPSGCGKTTLLKAIIGQLSILRGSIQYLDESVLHKRWHGEISYVPQNPLLLNYLTVKDNIALPLKLLGIADTTIVNIIIKLIGLTGVVLKHPQQLSGGYKQRVAIARALVTKPSLLLMDEPFTALDEFSRERLNEEFVVWQRKTKTTTLFVTHNIQEAVFVSNRVIVLTRHPATIIAQIPVHLPNHRVRLTRISSSFHRITDEVRKSLQKSV